MSSAELALAALGVVMAAAGWYVFVYLYRWEWNRAIVAGVIFLAAEIALLGALVIDPPVHPQPTRRRVGRRPPAGPPDERVLRRLRDHAPEPAKPFAWLERSQTNVFVPVLLGAGVVLSGLAWIVDRVAAHDGRAVAGARPRPPADDAAARARRPARRGADRPVPTAMKRAGRRRRPRGGAGAARRRARRPDPEPARTSPPRRRHRDRARRRPGPLRARPGRRRRRAVERVRGPDELAGDRDGALAPIADGRYRVVLRPAVGDHERRKLVGCLEDLTVDRVRRRRRVVPDDRCRLTPLDQRVENSSSSEPGRTTGRGSAAAVLGLARERGVAGGLQLVGQLGTAVGDDLAAHEDVHAVGAQLREQPVVVGDRQHAEAGLVAVGSVAASMRRAQARRASMSRPESSSSRMAIRGSQHGQLQRLVALLLAAGQVDVERPVEQALLEPDPLGLGQQPARRGRRLRRRGRPAPRAACRRRRRRAPRSGTASRGAGRRRPAPTSASPARRRRRA